MITIRPARNGKTWEYDIRFRWPDGTRFRERANAPVASKSAAQRWAENRERELMTKGRDAVPIPAVSARVPTLATFWPQVVSDHYIASRKKKSSVASAEIIARLHLLPVLGSKRLDHIANADIVALKSAMAKHSKKTTNNALGVLSRVYRCAIEWGLIKDIPFRFCMFKIANQRIEFYEVDEYRRLLDGAKKVGRHVYLACLLAGSAGLRRGEVIGLRWTDLDLVRGIIHVEQATYLSVHVDTPKSGHGRKVPMTDELRSALLAARAPGVERVVLGATDKRLRTWFHAAQRRAGLPVRRGLHLLRHTFCSHLAMAGVSAIAIKDLAGHVDLKTTQGYMHLAPGGTGDAIKTLGNYHGHTRTHENSVAS